MDGMGWGGGGGESCVCVGGGGEGEGVCLFGVMALNSVHLAPNKRLAQTQENPVFIRLGRVSGS